MEIYEQGKEKEDGDRGKEHDQGMGEQFIKLLEGSEERVTMQKRKRIETEH